MAKAYIEIYCQDEIIRTYGGNTSEVRGMKCEYEHMSKDEFFKRHKYLTEDDYNTLKVSNVCKR